MIVAVGADSSGGWLLAVELWNTGSAGGVAAAAEAERGVEDVGPLVGTRLARGLTPSTTETWG